jgi:hypothetical protein
MPYCNWQLAFRACVACGFYCMVVRVLVCNGVRACIMLPYGSLIQTDLPGSLRLRSTRTVMFYTVIKYCCHSHAGCDFYSSFSPSFLISQLSNILLRSISLKGCNCFCSDYLLHCFVAALPCFVVGHQSPARILLEKVVLLHVVPYW